MIKPTINVQELRERIGHRAKSAPTHRFWGMLVHVVKLDTLNAAYLEAKRNGGAPGSDGRTFEQIEATGCEEFLSERSEALQSGTYQPQSYRRKEIPKESGKVRVISIPAIRDRVVQGALRLVLEPLFEVDFSDSSYGARPGRSAHDALRVVRRALHQRKHQVVDVDLSGYFDNLRHDRLMEKVARRIQDARVLALVKQFLKSGGKRGIPQGSPLSPLLANLALNDLDHAWDKGREFISYVRYLDDMVVLAPNSEKGRRWANRALARIREEAASIGVSLNEDKTRVVDVSEPGAKFPFLGFVLRWRQSRKSGRWYAHMVPKPQKCTEVLRRIRDVLRRSRHLPMQEAIQLINPILQGWVNYFRVGNSAKALQKVKYHTERKVRRFAAQKAGRGGHGWKRWSNDVVYQTWGLFADYRVVYLDFAKAAQPEGNITPM